MPQPSPLHWVLMLVLLCSCAPATQQGRHAEPRPPASPEQIARLQARCLQEHAAAKMALKAEDGLAAARAARALMKTYGALVEQVGGGRARKGACGETAAESVGQVAQMLHAKKGAKEQALEVLAAWVSAFARGARDIPAALVLAKMFEERRRWADAARVYGRLIALEPRGKNARGAAHAAVAMWSRVRGESKARPQGQALTRADRDFLGAIDRLLRLDPKTKLRAELLFRKARLLEGAGQASAALALCEEIVTRHERAAIAPHAALLLLEMLSRQKAQRRLMSWVQRLSQRPRLARGELGKVLRTLRLHAARREAQAHADARRYEACWKGYLALARARGEKRPDLALFNAAACQQSAGNLPVAIATRERLAARFPKSRFAPEALLQNGKANLTLGKAAAASRCFERFARRYPESAGAPGALVQAINARLKAGHKRQAKALLARMERQYAARFPQLVAEARKVIEGAGSRQGLDATVKPQ